MATVKVYGTIRNYCTDGIWKWAVLNNTGHKPLNITSVTTFNDRIEIGHDIGPVWVGFLVPNNDEQFAKLGLMPGLSVGIDHSVLSIYDRAGNLVDPTTLTEPNGNFWINGEFTRKV